MSVITPEQIKRIKRIEITTRRLVEEMLSGAYRSAFKGNGMEFEEVREFQDGDEVRTIDWNVSARQGKLFVKQFREERELTVILMVDLSASLQFGSVEKAKRELIAEVGAVLAFSAIRNWDKVGLLIFSQTIELYIPPRKGLRHVLRIVRELLARPSFGKGSNINGALSYLGKIQPKRAVVFLISDFLTNDPYEDAIKVVGKKHDLIAIKVCDPFENQLPSLGLVNFMDLETGAERLIDTSDLKVQEIFSKEAKERTQKFFALMGKTGCGSIALSTNEAYSVTIRKYFEGRKKRIWH